MDGEEEESDASQLSKEEKYSLRKEPPSLTDTEEEGSKASLTMSKDEWKDTFSKKPPNPTGSQQEDKESTEDASEMDISTIAGKIF